MNRRGVLTLLGGGLVLAAAGAGGWYAANGPSGVAREAWRKAGEPREFRRKALSYALLAPNPHNRQPWLVRLEGEDALSLYCDLDRRLPETDPYDRQITIGCGAFLHLLQLAAGDDGFSADITPFPEGEPIGRLDARPVARVRFSASSATAQPVKPLLLKRRTNRNVYDAREVELEKLNQIAAAGSVFGVIARTTGEGELAAKLRTLTWQGHERESLTARTMKESIDLMRIGKAEVSAHRDGISMDGQMIEFARAAGFISREGLLDPASETFRMGMDQYREKAQSARAFAWLLNDHVGRASEIAAGRAYMQLTLKAAELGLALHPWSQTLQEFPEMASLNDQAHLLIGEGRRIQMLARVGYAEDVPPAPRRGLAAHLREA